MLRRGRSLSRVMTEGRTVRILLVGLPLSLVALGAVTMVYYFRSGVSVAGDGATQGLMRKKVEKADLVTYVETLSTKIGERRLGYGRSLEIAAKYIESSLGVSNMGYSVRRRRIRTQNNEACWNLEVELPGSKHRKEIVVIGAHYDSANGTPGANDNATGVATLMCLANAFVGTENARTIRFVAFANEEAPFFQTDQMGSRHYAIECRERGENVVAMLSLESLGYYSDEDGSQNYPEELGGNYPTTGNFVAFVSNHHSRSLLEKVSRAFEFACDFPAEDGIFSPDVPGVAWSDHWSFWQAGYAAVMVTDTAPFRYPHYHKGSDTPDKVDFDRLLDVVRGLEEVVRVLSNPDSQ